MSRKIRMLRTEKGSPDGIHICVYKKDEDYTLPDKLANIFVNQMKAAMEVVNSPTESKMVNEAPSNKGMHKMVIDPVPPVVKKPKIRIGRDRND